jgi:hypothetical protein
VAEEKFNSLCGTSANGARWLVVSDTERQEQFEELSLLWAWGAEFCITNVGPSQVRSHLSTRMRAATLHHAGMAEELTVLWTIVSSTTKLLLRHSPDDTSWVELMNELTAKFWRLEELCLRCEGPGWNS